MERPVRTERRARTEREQYYYEDRGYAPQARQHGYYQEPSAYYGYQQRQAAPRGYRYYPYYAQ